MAEDIAFDPAWETLLDLPADVPVEALLAAFTDTAKGSMALMGAVRLPTPTGQRKRKRGFPESEKTKTLREDQGRLRICLKMDGDGEVRGAYVQCMRRLEGSIADDEQEAWRTELHQLCERYSTDRRAFTKGLRSLTQGATKRNPTATIAVRDESGRVRATAVKALEITRSYWSGVAKEPNPVSLQDWEINLPLPRRSASREWMPTSTSPRWRRPSRPRKPEKLRAWTGSPRSS